ncbi:uncharacterized protein, partial [Palaemon carinicauda]|uniref:uncharacterized protein n=1 Tax=Palaemon carinicauda TaxID=392227 RepID=UPI0035B5AA3A
LPSSDAELLVSMDAPTGKLQGDHEYDVKCRAAGVRPPPIVTWWLRGNRLTENVDVQSLGPDSTVSLLLLLTTPGDDGGILECRASSPTLPHLTASDSTELTVYLRGRNFSYPGESECLESILGNHNCRGVSPFLAVPDPCLAIIQDVPKHTPAGSTQYKYYIQNTSPGPPRLHSSIAFSNPPKTKDLKKLRTSGGLVLGVEGPVVKERVGMETCGKGEGSGMDSCSNGEGSGMETCSKGEGSGMETCGKGEDVPKATIGIDAGSSGSLDSGLPSSGLREGSSATLTLPVPRLGLNNPLYWNHIGYQCPGWVLISGYTGTTHDNSAPARVVEKENMGGTNVAPNNILTGFHIDFTKCETTGTVLHVNLFLVSIRSFVQERLAYSTTRALALRQPVRNSICTGKPPSQLVGCAYHEVTTDSAAVTCSAGSTSEKLTPTYHIEVREGNTVILTKNSSKPRFNLSTLSPGRDYVLAMYASHQKGRGKETTLLLRTPTPKAEEVAPERVSINLNNEPSSDILQPDGDVEEGSGLPVNAIVGGAAAVAIGLAGVVAAIMFCRARRSQNNSPGKSQQFHHVSHDSLLELPHGTMYQPCTRHPSRELLTTSSPGPVVVTQVTSGRSSIRSSPLPRRSSTRSAPGGTFLRRHRPRTPSVCGGPVHVVEVESDSITTPRVEIESPSKSLASIRMSLRGDTSEVRQSPPLSLPCDTLEPPATPAPNEMSQSLLPTDFQLHSASTPHLLPQTYVTSPIQALPQPLAIDPAHSVQLHAESPINTVSYTTQHISLTTQAGTVPQTLVPSNIFTTPHPYNTAPQICTAPQVHVATAAPDIITSQAPPTQTQIQNTPQIHIESEDHLVSHIQEAPQVLRVHEPLMHPETLQQQQQSLRKRLQYNLEVK